MRGWVLTGSGVEVMSHFGGMRDCLGGRGSRRVSRRASGSKWMSDSVKSQHRNGNDNFPPASPLKAPTVEAVVGNAV